MFVLFWYMQAGSQAHSMVTCCTAWWLEAHGMLVAAEHVCIVEAAFQKVLSEPYNLNIALWVQPSGMLLPQRRHVLQQQISMRSKPTCHNAANASAEHHNGCE